MSPRVCRNHRVTLNSSVIDTRHLDKPKQHLATFHMQRILRVHAAPDCLFNDASMLVNARGIYPSIDRERLRKIQIRIVLDVDKIIEATGKAECLSNLAGCEGHAVLRSAVVAADKVAAIAVARPPTDHVCGRGCTSYW